MSLKAMAWAIEQSCGGPSTKVTLWSIANYVNKETWCGYVSQKSISEETEQSPDSVQRRIPELVDRGLLIRIPLRYDGRKSIDFFVLRPSPHFGRPLVEIEPLLPRGFEIDPKFAAAYVAADCGSTPLPQTLPQPAENAAALVRQHEPLREPVEPERERERGREGAKPSEEPPNPEAELTINAAWVALVKVWPDIALQSEGLARSALTALSGADRKLAVERVPAFLAFHREKLGKAKLPFLHNYLNERSRWTTLPGAKTSAAGATVERKTIEAFSRPWWWLFFDSVRRLETALLDQRSAASVSLRDRVTLARQGIGWPVGASRLDEIILAGKAFVQVPVDGKEFTDWTAALRKAGVDLPRPDKAGWIFVPSQWPPDERERDEALREAAETVGAER